MVDSYDIDDIVEINKRQYAVVKKIGNIYLLVTLDNPIDILVGTLENGEFINETNQDMIKNILTN